MSEARPASAMMRSFAAAATMVATVILLGAALLRWRDIGWEALVWLAAFVIGIAIRTPHAIANRANNVVSARKDVTEHVLLFAMFVAMMALPMLYLASGVFAFADYHLGSILLLLRRKWAFHVFVISFAAFALSVIYTYGFSDGAAVNGPTGMIMSGVIGGAAIFFIWYAWAMTKRGVLR